MQLSPGAALCQLQYCTPATSTAAPELIAFCSCAQEVAWARKFLSELGFPQLYSTTIFEDNAAAHRRAH